MLPLRQPQSAIRAEKVQHRIRGQRRLTGPYQEFGPAARAQHRNLFYPLRGFQLLQHFIAPLLADPEPLSHRQRGRAVVQFDHHESWFHDETSAQVAICKGHAQCQIIVWNHLRGRLVFSYLHRPEDRRDLLNFSTVRHMPPYRESFAPIASLKMYFTEGKVWRGHGRLPSYSPCRKELCLVAPENSSNLIACGSRFRRKVST